MTEKDLITNERMKLKKHMIDCSVDCREDQIILLDNAIV